MTAICPAAETASTSVSGKPRSRDSVEFAELIKTASGTPSQLALYTADRGSGANLAATSAPRRKLNSRNVGTDGVADRWPAIKPATLLAATARRTTPTMTARLARFPFTGASGIGLALTAAGIAVGLEPEAGATCCCPDTDWADEVWAGDSPEEDWPDWDWPCEDCPCEEGCQSRCNRLRSARMSAALW